MIEVNVFDLTKRVLKKWYIIALSLLVFALGFYGVSRLIPKQYEAKSRVYIRGSSSITASLADLQIGSYLSNDYEVILKSRPVLENTIKRLGMNVTTKELEKMISVNTIQDTRIIEIVGRTNDPALSKDIVNIIVEYGIKTINEIDAKTPYIIEKAVVNNESVSLSDLKVSVIGAVLGLVISIVYLAISEILNRKVDSVEDLESLGINILGQLYEDSAINTEKRKIQKGERDVRD